MKLTPHFTLAELTVSRTAKARGIPNDPPRPILQRLKVVAALMEQVRLTLGDGPIIITSGWRSPEVNRLVGGVSNSDHIDGWCADFIKPGMTPFEVVHKLANSGLPFDQLINEQEKGITHISFAPALRQDVLTQQGKSFVRGNVR